MMTRNDLEVQIRRELVPGTHQGLYTKIWCKSFVKGCSDVGAFDDAWAAYERDQSLVVTKLNELCAALTPPTYVEAPYAWWIDGSNVFGVCVRVEGDVAAYKYCGSYPFAQCNHTDTREVAVDAFRKWVR